MTVWKVTCHWLQENDYSYSENGPTNIGIFTSKPLAALFTLKRWNLTAALLIKNKEFGESPQNLHILGRPIF